MALLLLFSLFGIQIQQCCLGGLAHPPFSNNTGYVIPGCDIECRVGCLAALWCEANPDRLVVLINSGDVGDFNACALFYRYFGNTIAYGPVNSR